MKLAYIGGKGDDPAKKKRAKIMTHFIDPPVGRTVVLKVCM